MIFICTRRIFYLKCGTNLLVSTYYGEPVVAISSECIKWRQTSGCRFDGIREPENDKNCDAKIEWESGFCECKDGRKAMKKGCDLPSFYNFQYDTCNEACGNQGIFILIIQCYSFIVIILHLNY